MSGHDPLVPLRRQGSSRALALSRLRRALGRLCATFAFAALSASSASRAPLAIRYSWYSLGCGSVMNMLPIGSPLATRLAISAAVSAAPIRLIPALGQPWGPTAHGLVSFIPAGPGRVGLPPPPFIRLTVR